MISGCSPSMLLLSPNKKLLDNHTQDLKSLNASATTLDTERYRGATGTPRCSGGRHLAFTATRLFPSKDLTATRRRNVPNIHLSSYTRCVWIQCTVLELSSKSTTTCPDPPKSTTLAGSKNPSTSKVTNSAGRCSRHFLSTDFVAFSLLR
jgi:hypothetical protein